MLLVVAVGALLVFAILAVTIVLVVLPRAAHADADAATNPDVDATPEDPFVSPTESPSAVGSAASAHKPPSSPPSRPAPKPKSK